MGFKNLLEAATSETLMEDNLQLNLEVVDAVRAHELPHKDALNAIRFRLKNKNPNIVLRSLSLLEMVVKNCGAQMQCLVAQKDFMDEMRAVINSDTPLVRKKALELMQMWGHAFKDQPNYRIVPDTVASLRAAGFEFPPFNANATTMFVAEKAPDWVEGENCFKCRSAFNWPFPLFNRKHHCRNCGQIFCQKCSSKTAMLPRFAIDSEVRVCDTCYDRLKAGVSGPAAAAATVPATAASTGPTDLLSLQERLLRGQATEDELMRALSQDTTAAAPPRPAAQEARLKEEEELQLAMALSISEAQSKPSTSAPAPSSSSSSSSAPRREPARPVETLYPSMPAASGDDAVSRYPTLRPQTSSSSTTSVSSKMSGAVTPASAGSAEDPLGSFLSTLKLLEQRMDMATQAGRHLSTDPAAQTLYRSLLTLHREVLAQLDTATRRETKFLAIQAKQLDIDAARAQADAEARAYAERLQQQQREQELLAKMQLEQKMKLLEAQQREQREYQRAMGQTHMAPTPAPAPVYAAPAPTVMYPPRAQYDASPAPGPTPGYGAPLASSVYAPPPTAPGYGAPSYAPAPATAPAPGPTAPAPPPVYGGDQYTAQYGAGQPAYRPPPAPAPASAATPPPGYAPPAPGYAPAPAAPYGAYAPAPAPAPVPTAPVPAPAPGYGQQGAYGAPQAPGFPPMYGAAAPAAAPNAPATAELISFD